MLIVIEILGVVCSAAKAKQPDDLLFPDSSLSLLTMTG